MDTVVFKAFYHMISFLLKRKIFFCLVCMTGFTWGYPKSISRHWSHICIKMIKKKNEKKSITVFYCTNSYSAKWKISFWLSCIYNHLQSLEATPHEFWGYWIHLCRSKIEKKVVFTVFYCKHPHKKLTKTFFCFVSV